MWKVVFQDNLHAYRADKTIDILSNMGFLCIDIPPYSSDIGPSYYLLFSIFKTGKTFNDFELIVVAE